MARFKNGRLILILWILIAASAAVLFPFSAAGQLPAFLLLWVTPAITWTIWGLGTQEPGDSLTARFLFGAGLGLLLNSLLVLTITYLPGSPPRWALLGSAVLVAAAPPVMNRTSVKPTRQPAVSWLAVGILALAILLRLANMDYKELQGDEGIIMVRAAAVLTGDEGEIFLHQKGPVEILLPMAAWGLTGAANEFWARMPFTWAGILGVGMIYILGCRWFGRKSAVLAALLFAICGFAIAFSRIIQYQTLVMLWGGLSLFAALRYREAGQPLDLILAAVFLAGGLLAHYDAIMVAPAIGWLLLARVRMDGRFHWAGWLAAGLLAAGILALFYGPFILNPNFDRTFTYLLQGRVGTDESGLPFNWSGAAVWQMITFYNSLWYILGLLVLVVIGLWRVGKNRGNLALLLYFFVPLLFYTLIVGDPRTHVYTFFPGAVLLASVGAVAIADRLPFGQWRWAAGLLFGGWLVVSTLYVGLLFVEVSPERQRTWTENRPIPLLYPTTWDEPPLYGLFGFPHQAGWRQTAALLPPNALPYASNEEEEITNYYMRQAARTHCEDFETFILVSNVQDEIPYDPEILEPLFLQDEVMVDGEITMRIFSRQEAGPPDQIAVDNIMHWVTPEQIRPPVFSGDVPVGVNLAGQVRLSGYDISRTAVMPGDRLVVRLYWEVLAPFEQNKQVFVHLSDGEVRAQGDSAPECGVNPTTRWEPGQIIVDPHLIEIPADLPPGPLQLIVGMYDLITKERLARSDGMGDDIYLRDLVVR